MSQRESGYERKERDLYETPEWVTEALLPHLPRPGISLWEPACGSGRMSKVLADAGYHVSATDISDGVDFLTSDGSPQGIVTNPPYVLAQRFIERALSLTCPGGFVAMLLRTDYDHAKTRQHLFSQCEAFAKKIVLTKRIVWFDGPGAAPSFNHAWYVWDWEHDGPPTLAYGPAQESSSQC